MDSTIDKLISDSNNNNKLINYIPKYLKFSYNRNISANKSKQIPAMLADVREWKKIPAVPAAGLFFLWDTGSSHYVIRQHYVKKYDIRYRRQRI